MNETQIDSFYRCREREETLELLFLHCPIWSLHPMCISLCSHQNQGFILGFCHSLFFLLTERHPVLSLLDLELPRDRNTEELPKLSQENKYTVVTQITEVLFPRTDLCLMTMDS